MPTMATLKDQHWMIGVDIHDEVSPPGVPAPKIPHMVSAMLFAPPWGAITGNPNVTVLTTMGMAMTQGTDIGFLIPHLPIPPMPANLLAPVLLLTSGSKSHFGAHNHKGPQGPFAFACLKVVNLNLNCAGPTMPPLPSGNVLAMFQLVWQGVTWGDLIAGTLHLVIDLFVQFAINRFLGPTGRGGKALTALSSKIGTTIASRVTVMGVRLSTVGAESIADVIQAVTKGTRVGQALAQLVEAIPGTLASYAVGTPVGYSPGIVPVSRAESAAEDASAKKGGAPGVQSKAAQAIDNYLDSPATEQHPSGPPPTSVGPTVDAGTDGPADGGAGAIDGGAESTGPTDGPSSASGTSNLSSPQDDGPSSSEMDESPNSSQTGDGPDSSSSPNSCDPDDPTDGSN